MPSSKDKATECHAIVAAIHHDESASSKIIPAASPPPSESNGEQVQVQMQPGAYFSHRRARGEIPSWAQNDTNIQDEEAPTATATTDDDGIHQSHGDPFVAEVITTETDDNAAQFVIEGVKVRSNNHRLPSSSFIFIVVVVVVSVSLATFMITNLFHSMESNIATSSTATGSPASSPIGENHYDQWTISEYLFHDVKEGPSVAKLHAGKPFLEMLNRTDVNFTYFGFTNTATLLGNVDVSLIAKIFKSSWNGHVLNMFQGITVMGHAWVMTDLYSGLVLTSMAGYPLEIQLDPFRVNNNSMSSSSTEQNIILKNGVIHNSMEFPMPLVPWINQSTWEILLETNDQRQGDLSIFIDFVNRTQSILSMFQNDYDNGITVFVPNNTAFSVWMDDSNYHATTNNSTFVEILLSKHISPCNFARNCWRTMDIVCGKKISSTELKLTSNFGNAFNLTIHNDLDVIINEEARIVQEDIFSVYGILHVIDKVLLNSNY